MKIYFSAYNLLKCVSYFVAASCEGTFKML